MASLTKPKLVTAILTVAGLKGDARKKQRAKLEAKNYNTLRKLHAAAKKAKAQGGKGAGQSKPKVKAGKSKSLPKPLVDRVRKLVAGIKAGKIVAKQGKSKPADYTTGTRRQKYERFAALYRGVRISKKKGAARPSVSKAYAQLQGTKYPYYLSRGYTVKTFKVGGGPSGPGLIRAIPGSGAQSFRDLPAGQQAKVVKFLNGAGASLRSKGARKQVNLVTMQKQAAASGK